MKGGVKNREKIFPHGFLGLIKIYWPAILAGCVIALEALAYNIRSGDFLAKYHEWFVTNPFSYISQLQPRFIVDRIVPYFLSHNLVVFILLTVSATFVILYNFSKVLKVRDFKFNLVAAIGFIILFPFGPLLASAGPFATICVYLFPAAALSYGLRILTDVQDRRWVNIVKIIAMFYAANQEQFAVMGCVIFTGFFAKRIYEKRKLIWPQIAGFITVIISTILTLLGDYYHRGPAEMKVYFPQFANLSILRKIDIGFVDTMQHFFVNPYMLLILILILILIISIKRKKLLPGILSSSQLVLLLTYNSNEIVMKVNSIITSWNIKNYGTLLSTSGITGTSIHSFASVFPDMYFVLMTITFLVTLFAVVDNFKDRFLIGLVLLAGFASRMIMSFSPTIYVSSDRTFFAMLLTLFFVFLFLFKTIFLASKNVLHAESA